MAELREKLTYANVVATLALVIALGIGTAWAGTHLGKDSVKAKQIKAGAVHNSELASDAVTSDKVQDGSLLGADFAAGQLPTGATGPQGPQGEQGPPGEGIQGEPGTARAYAAVKPPPFNPCNPNCTITNSKGISQVTHPGVGIYCVRVPGVNAADEAASVSMEYSETSPPYTDGTLVIDHRSQDCATKSDFEVRSWERGVVAVRNSADNGSTVVASINYTASDDYAFMIVVP
jgi:hypothetical protein